MWISGEYSRYETVRVNRPHWSTSCAVPPSFPQFSQVAQLYGFNMSHPRKARAVAATKWFTRPQTKAWDVEELFTIPEEWWRVPIFLGLMLKTRTANGRFKFHLDRKLSWDLPVMTMPTCDEMDAFCFSFYYTVDYFDSCQSHYSLSLVEPQKVSLESHDDGGIYHGEAKWSTVLYIVALFVKLVAYGFYRLHILLFCAGFWWGFCSPLRRLIMVCPVLD